jgi:DNA-binding NtrC family response regulator
MKMPQSILLSFTGFHDPFAPSVVEGQMDAGPVLSVLAERKFDLVFLFSTPRTVEITEQTKTEITKRHKATEVESIDLPLKDPTNYLGILRQLRLNFRRIHAAHPEATFAVSVSSGTPHMHASWILLAASGEIPALILQSTPPAFVPEGKSRIKEIDLSLPDFPHITKSLSDHINDEDDEQVVVEACRELGIVGEDAAFLKALREAQIYSSYDDVHALLLGETGAGKEYFARFIHHLSRRSAKPLVTINCSSVPENLVESHFFGHKKGAFTGATSDQPGRFLAADGGTLFLDEIGELPLPMQAKLLRFLEDGEIEPVGSTKSVKVDVRVVAATNRDLKTMILNGGFREDLYQRFGSCIQLPPLRQRKTDIPKLAAHLLESWNAKHKHQRRFTSSALARLTDYSWPGNVRELRKVVTQSAMLCVGKSIGPEDLRFDEYVGLRRPMSLPDPVEGFKLIDFLDDVKASLISRALEKSERVQAKAARLLGVSPQAIHQFLKAQESQ